MLYNVTVNSVIVVDADSEDEAIKFTQNLLDRGDLNEELSALYAEKIENTDQLVNGWETDYIPYNKNPDKAILEYLV